MLAGALLAGCRAQPPVALDLAAAAPLADHHAPWELFVFGSPSAEVVQGAGIVVAPGQPSEEAHAWAAVHSELVLRWPRAEPRLAVFDMAPHPSLHGQEADVFLNDETAGHLVLEADRRRYAVELPASRQKPGHNVLRLAFAYGSAPQKPHRLRLGAALYSLAVGPAADPTLGALAVPGAPPPLFVATGAGPPKLTQVGPSGLHFAFAAPAGGELRFTPGLHSSAPAGSAASLRVTLEEDRGPERELWSGTIGGSGAGREVAVPLNVPAGQI